MSSPASWKCNTKTLEYPLRWKLYISLDWLYKLWFKNMAKICLKIGFFSAYVRPADTHAHKLIYTGTIHLYRSQKKSEVRKTRCLLLEEINKKLLLSSSSSLQYFFNWLVDLNLSSHTITKRSSSPDVPVIMLNFIASLVYREMLCCCIFLEGLCTVLTSVCVCVFTPYSISTSDFLRTMYGCVYAYFCASVFACGLRPCLNWVLK